MARVSKHTAWLRSFKYFGGGVVVIIISLWVSNQFNLRWDLTEEKRYTLTEATTNLLKEIEGDFEITVYLEGDDLPTGIKNIRNHTRDLLEDMRRTTKGKLKYTFVDINTIKNTNEKKKTQTKLIEHGILPVNLEVNTETGYSEKLIYPGAIVKGNNRELGFTILENQMIFGAHGAMENSLNFLEYKVINTIDKLMQERIPTIAFLQGHGEVGVNHVSDFLETLTKQNFSIKKIEIGKDRLLDGKTDVLIVAKPTEEFSEDHKFILDQYILRGGKVLWLIDQVIADMDSFRIAPSIFSIPRNNNLDDLLFRYGVRVNNDLVLDLYCVPVPIVEEIAGNPTPKLYPWVFYPMVRGDQDNLIVKNLDPVLLKFPSSIDTLASKGIQKTVLLSSSQNSRIQNIPFQIALEGARQRPLPELFNQKDVPMAVLLEGEFASHYAHRAVQSQKDLMEHEQQNILVQAEAPAKMIVVSDGDVIVNETDPSGRPLPLGYYRIDRKTYANKDFLLNAVEYLVDRSNLISARNRDISMRVLDREQVQDQKGLWQFITVALPIPIILLFGWFFNYRRRSKYSN